VHRALAEGEYVVTHATTTFSDGGQAAAFDLWKIADGRIVGHWGDQEPIVQQTANGHTQVDGPVAVDPGADTQATRRVVAETVRTILVENDFSDLDRYLAGEAYIQHNPRFGDGISGLAAALGELAKSGKPSRTPRCWTSSPRRTSPTPARWACSRGPTSCSTTSSAWRTDAPSSTGTSWSRADMSRASPRFFDP